MTAWLIYFDSPKRHLLQFFVSAGQLYGDVLYYGTTLLEGAPHCRPEPFYFWFYFVFMNSLWIVFPLSIMISSGSQIILGLESAYKQNRVDAPATNDSSNHEDNFAPESADVVIPSTRKSPRRRIQKMKLDDSE